MHENSSVDGLRWEWLRLRKCAWTLIHLESPVCTVCLGRRTTTPICTGWFICTRPCTNYLITCINFFKSSQHTSEAAILIILIVQTRKLRNKEVKELNLCYVVSNCHCWNPNLSWFDTSIQIVNCYFMLVKVCISTTQICAQNCSHVIVLQHYPRNLLHSRSRLD